MFASRNMQICLFHFKSEGAYSTGEESSAKSHGEKMSQRKHVHNCDMGRCTTRSRVRSRVNEPLL